MFILIYLLTTLSALFHAQSLGDDQKPQYSTTSPAYNKQWQRLNYNQKQGVRNMNYMRRNYTTPKQQTTGDAVILMKSRLNSMQRMKERDMFLRRGDPDKREGKMPTWSVPRAKDRLHTGTNVPTNTEVPAWSMKWSKYIDMPLYNIAGSTNADAGMKMPGMSLSKDIDTSLSNRARDTVNNPGPKLQESSARRSYNQDIPQFGKSEIPTDELRKTLKNIDEQLAKYKNGIYKLFKPNYFQDNPKLEAIKKQDIPIDAKIHTVLKTLKTNRKGIAFVPAGDISDISI